MTNTPSFALLSAALAAALLCSSPSYAQSQIWADAAKHAGVPVKVIHGIAMTESGRTWSDGLRRPWPWTLNSQRGAMYFPTKEKAAATLRVLLNEGLTNIDIGYMQINCGYHCSRVKRPEDLLDPSVNVMVAAQILREVRDAVGGDVGTSVGAYHAGLRPDRTARLAWYRDVVASNIRRIAPPSSTKGS